MHFFLAMRRRNGKLKPLSRYLVCNLYLPCSKVNILSWGHYKPLVIILSSVDIDICKSC